MGIESFARYADNSNVDYSNSQQPIIEQEKAPLKLDRGFADGLWTQMEDNSVFAQIGMNIYDGLAKKYDTDPLFNENKKLKLLAEHKHLVEDEYTDYIMGAVNEADFYERLENKVKSSYDNRVYFENNPLQGFVAGTIVEASNVLLYAKGLQAVTKVAPSLVGSLSTSFAGNATLGMFGEGAMTALQDVIGQRDKTLLDYGVNIGLGAIGGGLLNDKLLPAKAGKAYLNRQLKLDSLAEKLNGKSKDEAYDISRKHFEEEVSTDNFKNSKDMMDKMQEWTKQGKIQPEIWEKLRQDTSYVLKGSESETLSSLAEQLFRDSTIQRNRPDTIYGEELASSIERSIMSNYDNLTSEIVINLGEALGKGAIKSRFGSTQQIIDNLIGELQVNKQLFGSVEGFDIDLLLQKISYNLSKQTDIPIDIAKGIVLKANKASEGVFTFAHDRLASAGKKEFVGDSAVKKNPNYMPIIYDRNMASKLSDKKIDYGIFKKFLTESMKKKISKNTEFTSNELIQLESIIEVVAKKIWKNKDSDIVEGKSFDDILINTMVENGMTNEAIENLFKATGYADGSASKQNAVFARTRSPFDYSFEMEYGIGSDKRVMNFTDLIETNMGNVVTKYARKMGGNTALEKTKVLRDSTDILDRVNNTVKSIMEITQRKTGIDLGSDAEMSLEQVNDYLKKAGELPKDTVKRIDDTIKELADELEVDLSTAKEIMRVYGENKLLQKDIETLEKLGKETISLRAELEKNEMYIDDFTRREISLDNDINIAKAREQIHRELVDKGTSSSEIDKMLVRFDSLMRELKGEPTSKSPFDTYSQTERIISNWNIGRLLVQTGWTMTAELAGTAMESGLKNFISNSSMGALIKQFRTGVIDDKLAREIQVWTGLGDQLNRAIGINKYDHSVSPDITNGKGMAQERLLGKAEQVSEKFAEGTLLLGGVKPLTAWLETIYAKSAISKMIEMGTQKNPLSRNQLKNLNEMGFSTDMAGKIFEQMTTHGNFAEKSWSNKHKVLELNFDKWDTDVRDMFIVGLRRKSHTVIQQSSMGDKMSWVSQGDMVMDTFYGKLATQLKGYMLTAYVKQFGRAIRRKDMHIASTMVAMGTALAFSDILQTFTNYAGNQDELEKKLEPEELVKRVINKMPMSSFLPFLADIPANIVLGEPVFKEDRYGHIASNVIESLPVVDLLNKIWEVSMIPNEIIEKDDGISNTSINAVSGLTGLNIYGTRTLKEMIKAENE